MRLKTLLRMRLILGAAGTLLLVSLGGPAVLGQDDKAVEAEDNNDIQFGPQFSPYFRQLYKTELRFMRLATEPTKQQYEKIAAEGDPSIKVALREYVKRFNGGNGNINTFNPSRPMTDAISKAVNKLLSPEQAARYQKELDARITASKRMAVDNLVVMVDKTLNLSADQRLKLVDILLNNWNESWNQTQYFLNEGRWFPAMPDAKISPILTESQRVIWKATNKNNVQFGIGGGGLRDGNDLDEEMWPEDALKKDEMLPPPKEKAAGPRRSEVLPPPREKAPDGGGTK
jgi:hypothetical protein